MAQEAKPTPISGGTWTWIGAAEMKGLDVVIATDQGGRD